MKKFIAILLAVLLLSVPAVAFDPYDDDPYETERQNLTKRLIKNIQTSHDEEKHTVIQGEWDTRGKHYTPATDGNKYRQDGTFMQKAAGGYIDTKTGRFVPSND